MSPMTPYCILSIRANLWQMGIILSGNEN